VKITTVLGTRPEIIRLSVIIGKLDGLCDHRLIHTGQNSDPGLSDVFFRELGVRKPDDFLGVDTSSPGRQIGGILEGCEKAFGESRPDRVLVLGDTNSALSVYIAKRMGIPVFHMEAGNRCFDDRVPEEINRRIVDTCSDVLMPYTARSRENLLREGYPGERIIVTGNPVLEVIMRHGESIGSSGILERLGLSPGGYFLVTAHRAENVDDAGRFSGIMEALAAIAARHPGLPVVFPVHPRTVRRLERLGPGLPSGMTATKPLGFRDFLGLAKNALMVLTDSGGVQEEACLLRVPCVTLRDRTERPETLENGMNTLAGTDPVRICESFERVIEDPPTRWTNPYGDGRTAERIVDRVIREIST